MTTAQLRILCQNDVSRATGYSLRKINALLTQDAIEDTPGLRFPLPLKPPPGGGSRREWLQRDLVAWQESRRQK